MDERFGLLIYVVGILILCRATRRTQRRRLSASYGF